MGWVKRQKFYSCFTHTMSALKFKWKHNFIKGSTSFTSFHTTWQFCLPKKLNHGCSLVVETELTFTLTSHLSVNQQALHSLLHSFFFNYKFRDCSSYVYTHSHLFGILFKQCLSTTTHTPAVNIKKDSVAYFLRAGCFLSCHVSE